MNVRTWFLCRKFCTKTNYSFVTTPIFYVNAAPHIGHLYSAVIADAVHRFHKLLDPTVTTRLCTGTDEHGTKIQQAAQRNAISVSDYCTQISSRYRRLFNDYHIDYTRFIRTTDADHERAVQRFWMALESTGNVYSSKYAGWYCVSDETFLTDSQLKESENGVKVSLESGHPVEWTEETNFMFRLERYQEDVLHWINSYEDRIQPHKFRKVLLDFLQEPLPDISISRPKTRVSWGVPVPTDATQTVYVWLDALVNYLTVAGYPAEKYTAHWPPTLQVLGKDILKFHGIYWPAFLIAAGVEPPRQLLVHSHWTVDNQKMSKSKLNVVDPNERAVTYTHEGMRYFLLREGVAHSDGNYSDTKVVRILNSELADTLGNLLSRCCGKALNHTGVYPAVDSEALQHLQNLDVTKRLLELLHELPCKVHDHYTHYNFYLAVDAIIQLLHTANNFFETTTPWKLKKSDQPADVAKLKTILSITMEVLRQVGIMLQPVIPVTSVKLLDKLAIPQQSRSWTELVLRLPTQDTALANGDALLFQRILPQPPGGEVQSKPLPRQKVKRQK